MNKIAVFSCTTNLVSLCGGARIYVDGTFSHCTKFFLQLFTLMGFIGDRYIPLAFCLLPNKQEASYSKLFSLLKNHCSADLGLDFTPQTVVIDFEKAIHNAVASVWSGAVIIGCCFHLGQAWWRKIQQLGLTSEYKDKKSEIGVWLKSIMGLTYLCPEEVSNCFVECLMSDELNDPRVFEYADYLLEYYIAEDYSLHKFGQKQVQLRLEQQIVANHFTLGSILLFILNIHRYILLLMFY